MNDKNSLIGMTLMVGLLMIYFLFFSPDYQKTATQQPQPQDTAISQNTPNNTQEVADATQEMATQETDSARKAKLTGQYGEFSQAMAGKSDTLTITTELLTLKLSTKGGNIFSAVLNKHKTQDSLQLPIIEKKFSAANQFEFEFVVKGNSNPISSNNLYFTPSTSSNISISGEDTRELKLVANVGEGKAIEQIYTFKGNAYDVGYKINFPGLRKDLKNSYYELRWSSLIPQTEQAFKPQQQKTELVYMQGEDMERMGGMSKDDEAEFVDNGIDWISFKSQFFSHVLIPKKDIQSANLEMTSEYVNTGEGSRIGKGEDNGYVRAMNARMDIGIEKDGSANEFTIFMGPNEYRTLKEFDVGLQKQMDLGYFFISQINVATIWIFKFLEKYISNYGIIIMLFAIFVKLIVFPMTYKSYVSMGKLRVLNQADEMKALDEKYKDDAQKLQMEKMSIYRKMGVSPLGGCLPMLFSYPILIAMFFFFPQAIELRHQAFLWAHDLSTYDSIFSWTGDIPLISSTYGNHISLFTILMAISIYIYTYFQQKSQPPNAAMPFMKYIPYMVPIIFVIFLNNYASALSWYYLCSNLVSIIQTTAIRATINDEKMLAEMREKAKAKGGKGKKSKNGKSSASKSRLERWMENQQKKQQDMAKQRQKTSGKTRRDRRKK